jgi:hypothetical protein
MGGPFSFGKDNAPGGIARSSAGYSNETLGRVSPQRHKDTGTTVLSFFLFSTPRVSEVFLRLEHQRRVSLHAKRASLRAPVRSTFQVPRFTKRQTDPRADSGRSLTAERSEAVR